MYHLEVGIRWVPDGIRLQELQKVQVVARHSGGRELCTVRWGQESDKRGMGLGAKPSR